eukprot:3939290-Rhodomonas_salina.1
MRPSHGRFVPVTRLWVSVSGASKRVPGYRDGVLRPQAAAFLIEISTRVLALLQVRRSYRSTLGIMILAK